MKGVLDALGGSTLLVNAFGVEVIPECNVRLRRSFWYEAFPNRRTKTTDYSAFFRLLPRNSDGNICWESEIAFEVYDDDE